MGVSVEDDDQVRRVDDLRHVPAAVRFISAEPLLGPLPSLDLEGVDWLIAGGKSEHRARLMDALWVAELRDACADAEVAFFFKQWGGRTPKAGVSPDSVGAVFAHRGAYPAQQWTSLAHSPDFPWADQVA